MIICSVVHIISLILKCVCCCRLKSASIRVDSCRRCSATDLIHFHLCRCTVEAIRFEDIPFIFGGKTRNGDIQRWMCRFIHSYVVKRYNLKTQSQGFLAQNKKQIKIIRRCEWKMEIAARMGESIVWKSARNHTNCTHIFEFLAHNFEILRSCIVHVHVSGVRSTCSLKWFFDRIGMAYNLSKNDFFSLHTRFFLLSVRLSCLLLVCASDMASTVSIMLFLLFFPTIWHTMIVA